MHIRELRYATEFVFWIESAHDVEYKVSVCTGALLLVFKARVWEHIRAGRRLV